MDFTIKGIGYSNARSYNIIPPNGPRFLPKPRISHGFSTIIKDTCGWLVLGMSYLKNVSSLVSTEVML